MIKTDKVRRVTNGNIFPSMPVTSSIINNEELWVFAYGSLMWRPGFPFLACQNARLFGYHRSLCVWSWVHRGTQEQPGLVFGLDAGGSCVGRAYQIAPARKPRVIKYLYQRELVTDVYTPRWHNVYLAGGETVTALTFTVNRQHPQYAGRLSPEVMAETIAHARGRSGPNPDYVLSTLAHMEELGIQEPTLLALGILLKKNKR